METTLIILSLVLTIISVVLGATAIWLSLFLYRFSDGALREIQKVSNRVDRSVGMLEQRVHGLHEDTFSLVRETVADMRSALWKPESSTEDGTRVERMLEQELRKIRSDLLERLANFDTNHPADQRRLEGEVDLLLRQSADAGANARRAIVRHLVIEILQGEKDGLPAADLMSALARDFPFSVVMTCLHELFDSGTIIADQEELRPTTQVCLSH